MKKLIWMLLLLGAVYYNAVIFNSESLLFFLYVLLFFMLCLLILCAITAGNIRVEMNVTDAVVSKGGEVCVNFCVTNTSRIPSGKVKIVLQTDSYFERKTKKTVFYVTVPGTDGQAKVGKASFGALLQQKMPGKVTIQVKKVYVYDFLGILSVPVRKKNYYIKDSAVVLPKRYMKQLAWDNQNGKTRNIREGQNQYVSLEGEMDIFQLRSYQPGDRLRNIHWKMTAKTNEITVFDREEETGVYAALFFDSRLLPVAEAKGRKYLKKKDRPVCEQYVTLCYNIGCSLLERGIEYYAVWYDEKEQDVVRYHVSSEEDVGKVMLAWNCLDRMQEGELETAYFHKYGHSEVIEKFTVNAEPSLIDKNGQVIAIAQLQDLAEEQQTESAKEGKGESRK